MGADRDVEFDILATDKSGPAVRSAADGLEKLGREAKGTERRLDDLGDETSQLSRKMLETKAAAKLLALQFANTGDKKLLKDFEKLNREANRLGRALKAIEPPKTPDVKQGRGMFGALLGDLVKQAQQAGMLAGEVAINSFGDVVKAMPAEAKLGIAAGLIGAAALAAPVIAGAVEGAVLAGVGSAGLAAGIALAISDPSVDAVFTNLGHRVMDELRGAARPFVGQLRDAADIFGDAFGAELPRIQQMLAGLAQEVRPLARGLANAGREMLPGIQAAAEASRPLLRALAAELPNIGRAVGALLAAFAAGGPGATAALLSIVRATEQLIAVLALGARASAPFLNAMSWLGEVTGLTKGEMTQWHDQLQQAPALTAPATASYEELAQSLGNTANQARALADGFNRVFNETMSLDQANLAVKQGWLDLKDAVAQNGVTLDENTRKGGANVEVIRRQIDLLHQKMQADIAAGNGTTEAYNQAAAAYQAQMAQLRQNLINLGYNAAKVDELIAKYEELAKPRSTTFTTVFRTVGSAPPGYGDAKTGHSRTGAGDYSGLSSWAPARFAEAQRMALADSSSGTSRTGGPVEVASNVNVRVDLDGRPFRHYVDRTVRHANERVAWRAKVGRR